MTFLLGASKPEVTEAQSPAFEFAGRQQERGVIIRARDEAARMVLESRVNASIQDLEKAATTAGSGSVESFKLQNELRRTPLLRKIVEAWRTESLRPDNARTWSLENEPQKLLIPEEPQLFIVDQDAAADVTAKAAAESSCRNSCGGS